MLHFTCMQAMQDTKSLMSAEQSAELQKIYDQIRGLIAKKVDLNERTEIFPELLLIRLSQFDMCADIIQECIQNGADPNITDFSGNFPLYLAVGNRAPNVVRVLLKNGANPNQNKCGNSALYKAMKAPDINEDECTSVKTGEIVRLLLAHKSNVNAHSVHDETPLMKLCSSSSLSAENIKYFAGLLLYHGIDTTYKASYNGKNAAEIARARGYSEVAKIIENCHKPLVTKMTWFLKHFGLPRDVAGIIAELRYCKTGV